jgi:hypothetical protein
MLRLFIDYTKWHYSYALVNIFRLAKEFVRFFLNLFSVTLFFKTLLYPIFSLPVDDVESSFIADMVAVFIAGIIIRIIGAIFRIAFITLGLFFSVLTVVFFTLVFVMWFSMPILFIGLLYYIITFSTSIL